MSKWPPGVRTFKWGGSVSVCSSWFIKGFWWCLFNAVVNMQAVCSLQSGNLAVCVKDSRLSSPRDSTGTFTLILVFLSFLRDLHHRFFLHAAATPVSAFPWQDLGARPGQVCIPAQQLNVHQKYCHSVIKQMQFPHNGVSILRARAYMIYSWLCLFQGASENMMERLTALLLKSVWMIESGVVVKWARENVSWFLSLNFWQSSFFLWFSRGMSFHCEFVRSIIASIPIRITAKTKGSWLRYHYNSSRHRINRCLFSKSIIEWRLSFIALVVSTRDAQQTKWNSEMLLQLFVFGHASSITLGMVCESTTRVQTEYLNNY